MEDLAFLLILIFKVFLYYPTIQIICFPFIQKKTLLASFKKCKYLVPGYILTSLSFSDNVKQRKNQLHLFNSHSFLLPLSCVRKTLPDRQHIWCLDVVVPKGTDMLK